MGDYEDEDEFGLALGTLEAELQFQQAQAWKKAKEAMKG
jgi:hypothetical protein